MLTFQDLQAAERTAKRDFVYEPDPRDQDRWRSWAHYALDGMRWSGDCDDLASTVLDVVCRTKHLGKTSPELAELYRAKVKTGRCPPGETYDHMVALARDQNGILWVLGDTLQPMVMYATAYMRGYRVVEYSALSMGTDWSVGSP